MSVNEQLFKRKVITLFKRLDADGNGSIEQEDLVKWAEKLIAFGNLSGDSAQEMKEKMSSLWTEYFAAADADKSGSISCDEMIDYIKATVGDDTKRNLIRSILPLIFDAIDSDKSGEISKEEFGNYFKSLKIDDSAVNDEVFSAMDKNNDGTLSKDEFIEFGRNFFTSDESDPARLFFGPLVD